MARHQRRPSRSAVRVLAIVLLAAVIVGGGTWAALEFSAAGSHRQAAPEGERPPSTGRPPSAVQTCAQALERGREAVRAARAAVAGWAAHVEAELDVDAGRISRAQADKIWDETEAGGPDQVTAFQAAAERYRSVRASCGHAASADVPGKLRPELAGCRELAALTDQTLAAARSALAGWKGHLRDMATGTGAALDAHAAVPDIERFRAAVRSYQRHDRCTLG